MSAWQAEQGRWRAWIEQGAAEGLPRSGTLDALDERVVRCFQHAAFPGQRLQTRVDGPRPEHDPIEQSFDSMRTVVRATAPSVSGTLEVALESSDQGLSIALEVAPEHVEELPTLIKRADDETDALYIPSLTKPAVEAPPADAQPELDLDPLFGGASPDARDAASAVASSGARGQFVADQSASNSLTSGMISVDDSEAAATITRGEIVRDPVVPRGKIVVDPGASGVYEQSEELDAEELDPVELDADDVETVEDGNAALAPPPAPAMVETIGAQVPLDAQSGNTVIGAPPEGPPAAPAPRPADSRPRSPGASGRPANDVAAVSPGSTLPPVDRDWVAEVFADHYAALLPQNHAQQATQQVDFFLQCSQLAPGSRVLDVGCGGGAHAVALASRGYQVSGFDASPAQIRRAGATAEQAGVRVALSVGDMRTPPVDGPFEAALCVGSAFGSLNDEQDLECLQRIRERLVPAGVLLLHVFNRDYIVGRLPTRSWWQGQGCLVLDEATLDSLGSRVKVHRTVVFEDGRQFDHNYSLRAYGLNELTRQCRRAGMAPIEYAGSTHTRGRFFGATSSDIWLLVRRS